MGVSILTAILTLCIEHQGHYASSNDQSDRKPNAAIHLSAPMTVVRDFLSPSSPRGLSLSTTYVFVDKFLPRTVSTV